MPPLRGAEVAVNGATGDSANRKWCDSIVVVYDQLLDGKYPFMRGKGARDAHVDDVQKFFQPKTGTLWQYFGESLQADIDHPAGTTLFHVRDGASVKYKPGLTVFLKRAQEITDLLFAKDPAKLGLTAQVRIRAVGALQQDRLRERRQEGHLLQRQGALGRHPLAGARRALSLLLSEGRRGRARLHRRRVGAACTCSRTASSRRRRRAKSTWPGSWTPPLGDGVIHADVKPAALLRAFRGVEIPRSVVNGAGGCGR